jgi:TRAP-type C4-dicarboxylate transport system permease small subunit
MEFVVRMVERVAGLFLALVALLIFLSVVLRYVFATNLPDAFDLSQYLQGIAIMWGLAVATYRGGHIAVDLLWEAAGPAGKRCIDIFARLVMTAFFFLLALWLFLRLPNVMASGRVTVELGLPIWPFYLAASLGVLACVVVSLIALAQAATSSGQGDLNG